LVLFNKYCIVASGCRAKQEADKDFLLALKKRGRKGVELVVSDDHAGLRKAIAEAAPKALWQHCWVHFCVMPWSTCPVKAMSCQTG
jgi:hypothetical protein